MQLQLSQSSNNSTGLDTFLLNTSLTNSTAGASLTCRRLPAFDAGNWNDIFAAFAAVPAIDYGQHWRAALQPSFLPAQVKTGFDDEQLWVLADFEDTDIFNTAVKMNEELYCLGDVFEIFLRALPGDEYIEFHVSPENNQLQLWWPRAREFRGDPGWKPRYLTDARFRSWTQLLPLENRWRVLAAVPYALLNIPAPRAGDEWLFSFGRYDYTRGRVKPVISSTSPHSVADFHRQNEWRRLIFENENY